MTGSPPAATVADTARAFAAGSLDPLVHTERLLAGVAACDDAAIFTEMLAERARGEAAASRERWQSGRPLSPLDGVPLAWKDLFDIAGRVTTAGSAVRRSAAPAIADAPTVAAAAAAGLVAIGATNMTEFAYSGIGQNPHWGTPRNPHGPADGPARAPGGSSAGSAVAVARGLVAAAMGSDTGGSVRAPAAFNGIVGYKASTGRYPMTGIFPLSRTLDSLGPLATTVEDCQLVDAALTGGDIAGILAGTSGSAMPLSAMPAVVVPETVVLESCEPAVLACFEAAVERMAAAGVRIQRRPMPVLRSLLDLVMTKGNLLGPEALLLHRALVSSPDAARIDRRVLHRLRGAEGMSAVDYLELIEIRQRLIAEARADMGDSVLAFPTTPVVAMPMPPLEADDTLFFRMNAQTLRNTMLGNFLDWCGVSLPCGHDGDGMPVGLLLSAAHGHDAAVLAAARTVERTVRGPA
jgi:aspartyl-tRNA(Asn)/glutamyl-tRNA(Gln) amidotransferase subunit A